MPVSMQIDATQVVQLTKATVQDLSDRELLAAVWAAESVYYGRDADTGHDHRRYLSRSELENVFFMVQRLASRRLSTA